MRRIFFIIICLFLAVSQASSMMLITARPIGGSPPACTTVQQTEDGASGGSSSVGNSSDKYFATKFTYTGTNGKAICKASVWLEKVGSPTRDYYVHIWSNDAAPSPDEPDSIIGTSDAIDSSTVAASEEETVITFSTPSAALTNGGIYWVGLYTASNDGSDYLRWHLTDGTTESILYSDDGSNWTIESSSKTQKFELVSE